MCPRGQTWIKKWIYFSALTPKQLSSTSLKVCVDPCTSPCQLKALPAESQMWFLMVAMRMFTHRDFCERLQIQMGISEQCADRSLNCFQLAFQWALCATSQGYQLSQDNSSSLCHYWICPMLHVLTPGMHQGSVIKCFLFQRALFLISSIKYQLLV